MFRGAESEALVFPVTPTGSLCQDAHAEILMEVSPGASSQIAVDSPLLLKAEVQTLQKGALRETDTLMA